ncbi:hypothetical protein F53441_2359 [Fusarium austroafricanum]|uniref:Uncharacterized protein n=1 Tax=Fusarium austroafricanum TaxID=2364996 RepID=A0A8H4KT77_9HYPO|nr:hypothetical protein F53441_2359 [Fusarium austroafricanum]
MYLQLIVFLLPFCLGQNWQKCSSFWPDKDVLAKYKKYLVPGQCRIFKDYPQTFKLAEKATTKVWVTYTQEWSRQPSKNKDAVKTILEESIEKTLVRYHKFDAKLPDEIVFILTTDVRGDETANTFYPAGMDPPKEKSPKKKAPQETPQKQTPCQIRLDKRWTTEATENEPRALQAISHEMYHCVQGLSGLGRYLDPSWIIEGSANFFSNLVFPASNIEWPDKKHSGISYIPSLPIYAHEDKEAYTASIFFQAQDERSDDKVEAALNRFVTSTPGGSKGLAERERLSTIAEFTDDFFLFAKKFAIQEIRDTDGQYIPIQEIKPTAATIKLDKAGTTGTTTLTTTPFTISVFKVEVDSGRTASIYSSANEKNQRLAYRQDGQQWTDMAADSTSGHSFEVPCGQPKTKQTYLILFISTANVKSDKVKVTVKTSKPRKCGARSGFIQYPFYNPKTGGGYCPKGSHSSRLAIWCCPDGTQLDESVATEISICCPTSKKECSKEIVPNHLRCANPDWRLFNKNNRQIACCPIGYYPTSLRYCVTDVAAWDKRYKQMIIRFHKAGRAVER